MTGATIFADVADAAGHAFVSITGLSAAVIPIQEALASAEWTSPAPTDESRPL